MSVTSRPNATRIFFYLVYAVLALIWIAAMALPTWRPLGVMIPFSLLLLTQGVLYGLAERVGERGWAVPYLVFQSLLALALIWLARGVPLAEALFAPIAGVAVGLLPRWSGRAVALLGIVLAWMVGTLLSGDTGVWLKLPWMVGMVGFSATYAVLFMRQQAERQRAETLLAQLEEAHGKLQRYAQQVEELTITEERHRMARELHDTLAQGLAGLIMQLEAVDDLLGRGEGERASSIVRRALERTRGTMAEARASIQALRLPLERGDLLEEIRRELERVRQDHGLEAILEVGPGEIAAGGDVAMQFYRIAQEGLNNVLRHARAESVTLRLWSDAGGICLSIIDDGVGFDPDQVAGTGGHFGLTGIRERARLAGGSLQVESRPGQGTRLTVCLPERRPRGEEAR